MFSLFQLEAFRLQNFQVTPLEILFIPVQNTPFHFQYCRYANLFGGRDRKKSKPLE
jgi:hypothetical protein